MSFFGQIADTWQALIDLIIRPPRHEYSVARDLGARRLVVKGVLVIREDIELMNARGHMLKCSHFQPAEEEEDETELPDENDELLDTAGPAAWGSKFRPRAKPFPCVVFCHGNAGSRVDSLPLLPLLLPAGISLFCFDFSGAGQSDGEFLSLGHFEKDDLKTVCEFLHENCPRVSRIGIWGHSMGASSCLLYAGNDGDRLVSAMVLDSGFSSLDAVIAETAANAKQKLGDSIAPALKLMPDLFIPMAVSAVRRSILKQAAFDISDVDPLAKCPQLLLPVLFAHADHDDMVVPAHSERLHEAYGGSSTLVRFRGNHNSHRPDFFLTNALEFLRNILRPTDEESPAAHLLFHNPLMTGGAAVSPSADVARKLGVSGKRFKSHGMTHGGEKCSHIGATAGSLSILCSMCCECNPVLRQKREHALAAQQRSRRYMMSYGPQAAAVGGGSGRGAGKSSDAGAAGSKELSDEQVLARAQWRVGTGDGMGLDGFGGGAGAGGRAGKWRA